MKHLLLTPKNLRRAILGVSLPGLLLVCNSSLAQIRIEQIDPGVLIKPQQIESQSEAGVALQQVDPSLRKAQPRRAVSAPKKTKPDLIRVAQPTQMPFIFVGVNVIFSDDPNRPALPVVVATLELK